MEMYESMISQEKLKVNKKLEEDMLKKQISQKRTFEVNEYKNENTKRKIEEIIDNYQFINKNESRVSSNGSVVGNLNYYNRIKDDTLFFKLNDYYKSTIDKDNWVKIYEVKYDPNLVKLINFLVKFFKIIILYKTVLYLKKIYQNNSTEKKVSLQKKDYILMLLFYLFTFGLYFINVGFYKRNITKIFIN